MYMEYCDKPTYFADKILEVRDQKINFICLFVETYTYWQQYEVDDIR